MGPSRLSDIMVSHFQGSKSWLNWIGHLQLQPWYYFQGNFNLMQLLSTQLTFNLLKHLSLSFSHLYCSNMIFNASDSILFQLLNFVEIFSRILSNSDKTLFVLRIWFIKFHFAKIAFFILTIFSRVFEFFLRLSISVLMCSLFGG